MSKVRSFWIKGRSRLTSFDWVQTWIKHKWKPVLGYLSWLVSVCISVCILHLTRSRLNNNGTTYDAFVRVDFSYVWSPWAALLACITMKPWSSFHRAHVSLMLFIFLSHFSFTPSCLACVSLGPPVQQRPLCLNVSVTLFCVLTTFFFFPALTFSRASG